MDDNLVIIIAIEWFLVNDYNMDLFVLEHQSYCLMAWKVIRCVGGVGQIKVYGLI